MRQLQVIPEKYWVLADQVVVSGSAFTTNLLLARTLGLTLFGGFAAIGMIQLFLLSVTMAAGSQVYQVVYHNLDEKGKRVITAGMLAQQLSVALLLVLLAAAVYMCCTRQWLLQLHIQQMGVVFWPVMAIAAALVQDFIRRALITARQALRATLADLLNNVLQLAGLVMAWWGRQLSPEMVWCIMALAYLPSLMLGTLWLKPGRLTSGAVRYAWQYQKSRCGWLLGSSLLQWGAGYFFVIAAGWWVGAAALGALRLAQYIFGLLNLLLQAIENYAVPLASKGVQPKIYWLNLLKKCLLLMGPLLLCLAVLSRPLLRLVGGAEYVPYSYVMYGLSLVYLVMTIGYPVRIAIRAMQLNRAYFTAYILSVCTSLLLAPWLLKHWQLYGVLVGLFLSQLLNTGYWLSVLYQKKYFIWKSFT